MAKNGLLFLICLFMFFWCLSNCFTATAAQNAGLKAPTSWNGKMSQTCIFTALHDMYAVNDDYETWLVLHPKDSKGTDAAAAMELLKDGVQVIIGHPTSAQAEVVAEIGNKSQVSVVSFSVTSPSLSRTNMPYFIRMIQDDNYQCGIYPSVTEGQILREVDKLAATKVRVFIVQMSFPLGPVFFLKVKEVGLMSEGNAWIITEGLTDLLDSIEHSVIGSMDGVLGLKTNTPWSKELHKFPVRMIQKIVFQNNLGIYCLHAYDTLWAVVLAAEIVVTSHSFQEPTEYKSLRDSSEVSVSEIGPQLLQEISKSNFKGLTGEVCLVNEQLQPPVFKIINVLGGEREVQFWIPTIGISQQLDVRTTKSLHPIIWPEDLITGPHWKKLRIGYPAKQTFTEFVKVELNHSSNGTLVTGFSIDVFNAVMEALPYDVPYEFVPLQRANGENEESSSDDLLHQVYLKKHDAVQGDIMITANRSLFVEFSKHYTDGGVSMFLIVLVGSLSALVLLLLSYILRDFVKELWKRLVPIVHGEPERQTNNIVILVDPSKH